jgi:hypothetical protein
MRRPLTISSFALAVALAPSLLFAQPPAQQPPSQTPPAQGGQPPAGQPPAGQPPAGQTTPAAPAAPKVAFTTPAGLLLVQVKPDQTATFEELIAKLNTSLAASATPELKQLGSFKVYKTAEGMGQNALYVVLVDPAVPNAEYSFLDVLNSTLTDEQKRAPETREMFTKYAGAFAGLNKLNLTPVAK